MFFKKRIMKTISILSLLTITILSGCASTTSGGNTGGSSSGNVYQWGDATFAKLVSTVGKGKTLKIGFTPPANSQYYNIMEHAAYTMMNEIKDRFGVNVDFEVAAPSDFQTVESQVSTIQDWTAKKFDAILVCSGGDFASMNSVYKKAMEQGTEIYMFNMPAEMWKESDLQATSVVTYNDYQTAYNIGQYAAKQLNGKGKILVLWGVPSYWRTERQKGFIDAIKQYPGMQIVGQQEGDYVMDKGMQAAENLLQAHPDVNLIYGENEDMALGAVQAINTRGLKLWDGKSGIMVIGADGTKTGFDSIKNGKLTATLNTDPIDMARDLIKSVFMSKILGYSVPKVQWVPTNMVDQSNVGIAQAYTNWVLNTNRK
jgi:ribose transport system substrate-binding protein